MQFEQAATLSEMHVPEILDMLAAMYAETGRYQDAVTAARRALDLANQQHNDALAASLKSSLERYESLSRGGSAPAKSGP